jgi:hypothetical protein
MPETETYNQKTTKFVGKAPWHPGDIGKKFAEPGTNSEYVQHSDHELRYAAYSRRLNPGNKNCTQHPMRERGEIYRRDRKTT